MLPSMLYLSRVTYSPAKKQVMAEFSNLAERISRRYAFFPKMFYPIKGIREERFREAVSSFSPQKFKVSCRGNTATIFAATFSDIKALNNFLWRCFGFRCNLVEPERQFLLERSWSYFDAFNFENGEPHRLDRHDFPEVSQDFLSEPLRDTVLELLRTNEPLANEVLAKTAMSRLLRVPLVGREEQQLPIEILLENIFFSAEMPISHSAPMPGKRSSQFPGKGELDFSRLVAIMSSKPFNNLGAETNGCPCCKPPSLEARNMLPSSLVKARFLRESFYFTSVSKLWAEEFHASMPFREEREARMKEYFQQVPQVGPFSRGSECFILLADAIQLSRHGFVELLHEYKAEWCCNNKESSLSRELNLLRQYIVTLGSLIDSEGSAVVASNGLFFSQAIRQNPGFFYRKALRNAASGLLASLPAVLVNRKGRFYTRELALAIEAINGGIVRDFEDSVAEGTERVSFPGFSKAVVDKSSLMRLAKRFSDLYKVETPLIALKNNS